MLGKRMEDPVETHDEAASMCKAEGVEWGLCRINDLMSGQVYFQETVEEEMTITARSHYKTLELEDRQCCNDPSCATNAHPCDGELVCKYNRDSIYFAGNALLVPSYFLIYTQHFVSVTNIQVIVQIKLWTSMCQLCTVWDSAAALSRHST